MPFCILIRNDKKVAFATFFTLWSASAPRVGRRGSFPAYARRRAVLRGCLLLAAVGAIGSAALDGRRLLGALTGTIFGTVLFHVFLPPYP